MFALFTYLLFGAAFAAALWSLYASVRPQLHRYRALFSPAPAFAALPLRANRVTVRWTPVQAVARKPLRAAA